MHPGQRRVCARCCAVKLDPKARDGIISMHLMENDPDLSKPLTDNASDADPGAGDWFVLIDGTEIAAIENAVNALIATPNATVISKGVYRLLWDLATRCALRSIEHLGVKRDISHAGLCMLHRRKPAMTRTLTNCHRWKTRIAQNCLVRVAWNGSNKLSL